MAPAQRQVKGIEDAALRTADRAGLDGLAEARLIERYGRTDLEPLWLAETQFAPPECVFDALRTRSARKFLGYGVLPKGLYEAATDWISRRHGWNVDPEAIVFTPNVTHSIQAVIRATVPEAGGIIVQTPAHPAFGRTIEPLRRRLIVNPMVERNLCYGIDLEHLDRCACDGANAILLCSPHNPVGRVWREEELRGVLDVARRHRLVVISDEVHSDIVLPGHRHTPLGQLAEPGDRVITIISPGKTFGLQGLGMSAAIVADSGLRRTISQSIEDFSGTFINPFTVAAVQAAYNHGDRWLDTLLTCITDNHRLACDRLDGAEGLRATKAEGTYLLWVDGRQMQRPDTLLDRFVASGIAVLDGNTYGEAGHGFARVAIGLPTTHWLRILDRLRQEGPSARSRP